MLTKLQLVTRDPGRSQCISSVRFGGTPRVFTTKNGLFFNTIIIKLFSIIIMKGLRMMSGKHICILDIYVCVYIDTDI